LTQIQSVFAAAPPCPFKDCHLEKRPAAKVEARLAFEISRDPEAKDCQWVVYACRPPDLPRQTVTSASLSIKGAAQAGKTVLEKSAQKRQVLRIQLRDTASGLQKLPVQAAYAIELASTSLLAGSPAHPVRDLSVEERKLNLMSTYSLDYNDRAFQSWLDGNDLRKHAKETDLECAWRVYLELRSLYRYRWSAHLDRRVSMCCRQHATDCGGLSYLYCAVLRAAGVPARALICRQVRLRPQSEDGSGYYSCHTRSEFFLAGVGWVPVDLSDAVSHRRKDARLYFGRDQGDFIVMHLNPDLLLDSLFYGLRKVRSMSDFRFWSQGDRQGNRVPVRIIWQVRQTELP
jgi:hypothetical protein